MTGKLLMSSFTCFNDSTYAYRNTIVFLLFSANLINFCFALLDYFFRNSFIDKPTLTLYIVAGSLLTISILSRESESSIILRDDLFGTTTNNFNKKTRPTFYSTSYFVIIFIDTQEAMAVNNCQRSVIL